MRITSRTAMAVCGCLIFAQMALAANLRILQPAPRVKTFNDLIILQGAASNFKAVTVNRIPLELEIDASFFCGLLLKPGKNFVEVTGWPNKGKKENQYLKILRLSHPPDVSEKHWAYHAIISLLTLGIIEGYPNGEFYPVGSISRGEFATWIIRATNKKAPPLEKDPFPDVPKEHWRAPYISAAVKHGFMKPLSDGSFGLDQGFSRAQAASAISRILHSPAKKEKEKKIKDWFIDIPKNYPYYDSIAKVKKKGLFIGISKRRPIFDPKRNLSRAEAAVLLSRLSQTKSLDRWLFNYDQGYQKSRFCQINTAPFFTSFTAEPGTFTTEKNQLLTLKAQAADREGKENILNVKVDLTPLLGPADAELLDDGKNGDISAGDGEYTLQLMLTPETYGEKKLIGTVTDKIGWEGKSEVLVIVTR